MAFKMKSGNKPEFKEIGGDSPMKWKWAKKALKKVKKVAKFAAGGAIGAVAGVISGKKGDGGGSSGGGFSAMQEKMKARFAEARAAEGSSGPEGPDGGSSYGVAQAPEEEAAQMSKKEMFKASMQKWNDMDPRARHKQFGMGPFGGFSKFMSEEGKAWQEKVTGEKMPDSPKDRMGMMMPFNPGKLGGMFSDVRLKENIENIGKSKSGIPIYKFNYIGDNSKYSGTMAQDLLRIKPEAVIIDKNFGYYKVNYNNIDVDMRLLN